MQSQMGFETTGLWYYPPITHHFDADIAPRSMVLSYSSPFTISNKDFESARIFV